VVPSLPRASTGRVDRSGTTAIPSPRSPGPSLLVARAAVPRSLARTLARPGLERVIDAAVQRKLTVVSAGPGWGKTTAVAEWASTHSGLPVAWLALDRHDNSPALFWGDVLHALMVSGAVPEGHDLHALAPAGSVSSEFLRSLYHAVEDLPRPVLLVLDDFQVLEDAQVLESVEGLLRHELPVRVVLITRRDPALPLHRLRLAGDLGEISAEDLAFTPEEIRELAEAEGIELHATQAALLAERTEGWPAGVRLGMLYLARPGGRRDVGGFAGEDRSVAEYLVAEVLDGQPEPVRDFLLRTSVVSPISAELAEVMVPGSSAATLLEELARSNMFVGALGRDAGWFRYHPLLREMLLGLLRRDDPAGFSRGHRAVALWFAAHHEPVRALRHAFDAEDWSLFAAIFVQSASPALVAGDRDSVLALMRRLPYADIEPQASVELCAAAIALAEGRFTAARAHLDRARDLEGSAPEQLRPACRTLLELMQCGTARGLGELYEAVAAGRAALRAADEAPWPYPALPAHRAVAANNLAVGLLWTGDIDSAREIFTAVVADLPHSGAEMAALNARSYLALCDLMEDRLDPAAATATAALEEASRRGWSMHLQGRMAHIVLAAVRVLRGDLDGADQALAAAWAANVGGIEPAAVLLSGLVQVEIAVSRGRVSAARQSLDAARDAARTRQLGPFLGAEMLRAETEVRLLVGRSAGEQEVPAWAPGDPPTPTALVCEARLNLAAGKFAAVEEGLVSVVTSSADHADGVSPGRTMVEAWTTRALAAFRLRRDRDALHSVSRALDVARPEGMLRPFLVTGDDQLARLLRLLGSVDGGGDQFLRLVQRRLDGTRSVDAGLEPDPLLTPLTDRELAMLAALPSMQSNAEIAAEFFVSVNTVKAHLKALYRKLGVGSRREAVRRGRELGLLS
jgi:LuxR family transcriptional regulator, maltose regulon positive regulatory protein